MKTIPLEHVTQIKSMTRPELVAFWNVCQFQRKLGSIHEAEAELSKELTSRGIPHEVGKRTVSTSPVKLGPPPTGNIETTARQVKRGEMVRFKDTDTAPVWVRDHYDRESKTYAFHKFDDCNHEAFVKGTRKCFIGFTY